MKNIIVMILTFVCLLTLAGCGADGKGSGPNLSGTASSEYTQVTAASGTEPGSPQGTAASGTFDTPQTPSSGGGETGGTDDLPNQESVTWQLRIVDGAESGNLLLAGENSGDVYSLSVSGIPVFLDGQSADPSALQDGMMIDVDFNGMIMETYPAMLGQVYGIYAYSRGTEQNPGGSYFDLCGLYLQVLSDLWDTDPGLNDNIRFISLDLSQAPGGLTEGEKSAIMWIFASGHGITPLNLSYEELAAQGYLTEISADSEHTLYQWEDGILFTITPAEWEAGELYSLPALKFNAEKWRSPRGADFFTDCLAIWPEMGTWSDYKIGHEAIS